MNQRRLCVTLAVLCFSLWVSGGVCRADSIAPFGVASAYNLLALGTIGASGKTVIAGTVSTSADVTGRIAAADRVLTSTTVGSNLGADPWGSLAAYDLVSTNGLTSGSTFNINSHGNVFAPGSNGKINFNGGGHRVTAGSSGIDFAGLRTALDAETAILAALTPNGVVGATLAGANPSWLVLNGTSATLNVFDITAAEFASANNTIDINAPVGSTVIVNVAGVNLTLGSGLYYNGQQVSGDSTADNKILFNFATGQTVAIDAQFNASVLAPYAVLTGSSQMSGNFIAAQIGQTGEVHNVEFVGTLPKDATALAPEPGSLLLLGTGAISMAGFVRRKLSRQGAAQQNHA